MLAGPVGSGRRSGQAAQSPDIPWRKPWAPPWQDSTLALGRPRCTPQVCGTVTPTRADVVADSPG